MTTRRAQKRLAALVGLGLALGQNSVAAGRESADRVGRSGPRFASEVQIAPAPRQEPTDPDVQPDMRPGELEDITPFTDVAPPLSGADISSAEARRIDEELLGNILELREPADRALALIRAARYKTLVRDPLTAIRALEGAGKAALEVADPLTRDLRLIGTSNGYLQLADEMIDGALADTSLSGLLDGPEPSLEAERVEPIRRVLAAYDNAARLAAQIERPTYNAEELYKIVERSAQTALKLGAYLYVGSGPADGTAEVVSELESLADQLLMRGVDHAALIERPAWRDRALLSVAAAAAASKQFDRAFEVAALIPYPEVRSEAFLRVAESAARRGTPADATRAYGSAARTIASVPIDDLRASLTNVLVNSLITSGRFVDARRAIVLYPDERRQLVALGAVAESMGARGLSDQAREWIDREVVPTHHDRLLRQVNDGVLSNLKRARPETFDGGPVR